MAALTNDQTAKIQAAVAEVLKADYEAPTMATVSAQSLGDVKDLFCKNWDTVKQVLTFISGHVPLVLRIAINTIIAIGDKVHAALCPVI